MLFDLSTKKKVRYLTNSTCTHEICLIW